MKNLFLTSFICAAGIIFSGCAQVQEVSKTFWGSSTRALEKARETGEQKAFRCPLNECFDKVIELTLKDDTIDPPKESAFDIFLQNRTKNHIVIMRVPGSVDTTEVGVFFTDVGGGSVRIEISSLSSYAKIKAAEIIFEELKKHFQEAG